MVTPPVRVTFVCSGNICRSPTAEVVLTALAHRTGHAELVRVDSSGTGSWHVGEDMDERSRSTLVEAAYEPAPHEARQFGPDDFAAHDVIVAMDSGHRSALWWLAAEADDPDEERSKLVLLRDFDPELAEGETPDVGDPYYGGADGFTDVLAQVERSCAGLLEAIERAVETGEPVRAPR